MLKKLLTSLSDLLTPKTQQQIEEEWLAKSNDLVELEWKQKQLTYKKGYWI